MSRTWKPVLVRAWAWWIQWWWIDLVLAAALVVALAETARPATGADLLGQLGLADRRAMYTNALQLTAIFAGFNGVAFTINLGFSSRSVRRIKTSAGAPLLRVWVAALVTPWVCAVILVCCGATDRGGKGSSNLTRWVAVAALIVVLLQMIRVIWVFYQLAVADLESTEPQPTVGDEAVRVVRPRAS